MRFEGRRRLALAAVLAFWAVGAWGQELLGRTVVSVACVADGPLDRNEMNALVAVKAGQPLSEEDAAATIRNLYATGRFADVRIEAAPDGEGAAVTVVLFYVYRVHPLLFAGELPVSRSELRKALPFSPDARYSGEAVDLGAAAIERRLQSDGYLEARARPEVTLDRERFRAGVTYVIDPGPAARTAEPFFDGDTAPFSPAELASAMKLKPGDRFRESLARADGSRMTEFLHGKDYLRAMVELIAAQPVEDGRVMPVYRVRVGPRVVFQATGITPRKLAKELHALAETQPIDEELVLQWVDARKEALQRSGHYRASVNYVFDAKSDPGVTTIRVNIVEGPKFFVEDVRFDGNASVPTATLYDLMGTHRKGLPLLAPGRLIDAVLAADAETILAYFQSEGWVRAKVRPPRVEGGSKPDGLVVTVVVEEGPRAFVESRVLEGAEHLDSETAAKLMTVKEGIPFNPNSVRQDVGALSAWYHDHGWREAAVRDTMALSDDGTKARIAYAVDEGSKSFFGKTIVRGNTRTRTRAIERLVPWEEGDAVSEAKLLDAQRSLSRSGVFRRVEVKPERTDPVTQSRNVDIDVEEGRPWSLLYGVGYQYTPGPAGTGTSVSDPYLTGGVSYNNLLGRMISAGLEAQFAPFSQLGRVQASLREPFLFGTRYPLNLFAFYSRELIQNVDLQRTGVAFGTSKIVAPGLRIGLGYVYQRIVPINGENLSLIDRVSLPAVNRPIDESTIGPDILFDRRDDIIDPHKGYYLTASYKYAFPFLSAETQFSKFSAQATGFLNLGRRWTLVGSARVGGIFNYRDDVEIPIAERFFAGGRSTERAFDTDLLGIPGAVPLDPNQTVDYSTIATAHTGSGVGSCASDYPTLVKYDCTPGPFIVGGSGFLALNVELRIPIAGNLGGVVFYDAAQVWHEFSEVNLKFEGRSGLRQGIGFGLRFMTPIGPARAEYAWPLQSRTIPFDVILQKTDASGAPVPCLPAPAPPCYDVLAQGTTKETGRFFFSIGFPF